MSFSNPTPVNVYQDRIILEIEKYDFHLIRFDEMINEKIDTLQSLRPRIIDSGDKSHYNNWAESEIYDFALTTDLLYNNAVTSYYSFLEHTLFDICNYLHKKYNLSLKVNELRGDNYIDQCKKYIEKVVGFKFDDNLKAYWIEIDKLRIIRNSIVHQLSNIYKNQEYRVYNQLSKQERRLIDIFKNKLSCDWDIKSGNFSINLDFAKRTSKLIYVFLIELTDKLCKELR